MVGEKFDESRTTCAVSIETDSSTIPDNS